MDSKHDFDLEVVLQGFKNSLQDDGQLHLSEYLHAFWELCRFFKLTGRLFGFVAKDLEHKIGILEKRQGSKDYGQEYQTVQSMINYEINKKITHQKGRLPSGSRTLLRLHRALEFIISFMSELSKSSDETRISHLASDVYSNTLAKHHPWIVRKMASLSMHMLPNRRHFIEKMCKHEHEDVLVLVESVVQAAQPLYDYIQDIYEKHDLLHLP